MFLRLNQIIFGGILYSVQSAVLISFLYTLAYLPFIGFHGEIWIITLTSLPICFLAILISFTFFMGFRFLRKKGNERVESWLIPLGAALVINLWLGMAFYKEWQQFFWKTMLFNAVVSFVSILISRRLFILMCGKLSKLKQNS